MVFDSRDPALTISKSNNSEDVSQTSMRKKNSCLGFVPGGIDCENQINKGKCVFLSDMSAQCAGNEHAIGSNITRALQWVDEKTKTIGEVRF